MDGLESEIPEINNNKVLSQAVLRAAGQLDVSKSSLARILGVSDASVSRLPDKRVIDQNSKEGELALLFLRVFRSLDTLVGGRSKPARDWFQSENSHIGGVPAELVESVWGLVHVAEYLDAMRGKF